MFVKNLIAAGALLSLVAAVPLQQIEKRDIITVTKMEEDVVTIPVTKTVWLEPGESAPAGASAPPAVASALESMPKNHGHHHKHHHHRPQETTPVVQPSPPASSPPAQSPPASSPQQSPPSTPTTAAAPSPTQTQPSSGSGGSPQGQTFTGDITHYAPGLGSCGITSTASQAIVALPISLMEQYDGANPNDNPLCGKTITISYMGNDHTATVVDSCGGCAAGSIDLSPSLFVAVAPNGDGRVSGVNWFFNDGPLA